MLALVAISTFVGILGDPFQSMIAAGVCGGFFAAVCLNKLKAYTIIPMVAVPPLISYLLTASPEKSVLSLSFVPVGLAVFLGIKKGLTRNQTIVRSIVGLGIFYGAVYSLYVFILFGAVSGENILKYIDLNLQSVRIYMENIKSIYASTGVDVEQYFSKELLDEVIESLRVSWLGYGLAIFGISSYLATIIGKSAIPFEEEFEKKNGKWRFVLSKIGAVIFILAYILSSLYSAEKEGLYFSLAINAFCLGMAPAVLFMGVSNVIQRLRSERRIFFLILLLISLSFGNFAILLLLIMGVFHSLTYVDESQSKKQEDENLPK